MEQIRAIVFENNNRFHEMTSLGLNYDQLLIEITTLTNYGNYLLVDNLFLTILLSFK